MDRRSFLASLSGALGAFWFGVPGPKPTPKAKPKSRTPEAPAMTISGWGGNFNGTAGLGDLSIHATGPVAQPVGIEFTQISTNGPHCAAIDASGNLYIWGDNLFYRLGTGESPFITPRSTPYLITQTGITDIVEVCCTRTGTFARKSNGTIYFAGNNASGQNGEGAGVIGNDYTTFTALTTWSAKSVARMIRGADAIAMLLTNGQLWFAGKNNAGEAGDGTSGTDISTPIQWGSASDIIDASLVADILMVVRGNGEVWGSGGNFRGPLMDGTTTDRLTPVHSTTAPANPAKIGLCSGTSFVIDTSGNVWAAGNDDVSQVSNSGTGNSSDHTSAVQIVVTGKTFAQIVTSWAVDDYALRTTDGLLYALGTNTAGNGKPINSSGVNLFVYTPVWSLTNVIDAHSPGNSEAVFLARVSARRSRAWAFVLG